MMLQKAQDCDDTAVHQAKDKWHLKMTSSEVPNMLQWVHSFALIMYRGARLVLTDLIVALRMKSEF